MSTIRSLLKDTMVYGLTNTMGKFLNWLLTFVYVRVLLTSQFGKMTNMYAWTALLLIFLTYGMETGFFRFVNKSDQPRRVYSTTIVSLGITSLLFIGLIFAFLPQVSSFLEVSGHPIYVIAMAIVVASDAFMAIPLAYLRYSARPWRFFLVRTTFTVLTIVLTVGIFTIIPYLFPSTKLAGHWLSQDNRLQWVFLINLTCNGVQFLLLLPEILKAKWLIDIHLLKKMLRYSFPILLLGLAGSFSNQADKILFPRLFADPTYGDSLLGIYGGCYKLALMMVLLTQAFRYAYDPFIFAQTKKDEATSKKAYSITMRYFILFTLFVFMFVMTALDILKHFVAPNYYPGLVVVPYVMAGQLMFGIYYNLATWYKVTDKTMFGAIFSTIGCLITVVILYFFATKYGFMACAWASVLSNGTMMLLSYIVGQYYYPIDYKLPIILKYTLITTIAYGLQVFGDHYFSPYTAITFKWIIFIIYLIVIVKIEWKKGWLPILSQQINRFIPTKKNGK